MIKKLKQTIILALIALPILSSGQGDYLEKDSAASINIKLIDGSNKENFQVCKEKIGDKTVEYTPYEVSEYGFKNGRVYVSKEIQISDTSKRVFLERLLNDKTILYLYKGKAGKQFYIEKDSNVLIEISKENADGKSYREQLAKFTNDCHNTSQLVQLVSYTNNSLVRFFKLYNNCKSKPFPHFKFGPTLSYESFQLVQPNESRIQQINYFDFDNHRSLSAGMFFDFPLKASDFSIHSEILISKHGFSYNYNVDGSDLDFVTNLSSFKIPLLLRYTCPINKLRPFLNIGVSNLYHFRNETMIYETTMIDNTIIINDVMDTSPTNDYYLEYTLGGGLEYQLNYKNSLFLELRYSRSYVPELLGTKSINIITGFNF